MPGTGHLEIARAALEAGKHVICEKPTALNAHEARQMLDASRAHPRQIAIIDHELRFLPSFHAARERVRNLGGIRYVEARYSSPNRGDRTRAWNWWSDASQGGGVWGAVGSHFVDAMRYLFNQINGDIDAVQATMETIVKQRSDREVTSDDFAAAHLRLRNGAIAAMTFSAVASGPDEPSTITIHGENGALKLAGEELLFAKAKESWTRVAGDDLTQRPGNSPGGAFGTGTHYFALALKSAIEDDDKNALAIAATFDDGLAQQRVLDAARESSAKNGCWIDIRGR